MNVITRKALLFLAIAFGLSWGLSSIMYITDVKMGGLLATLILSMYMLMPLAAVLIVQKGIYKGGMQDFGLNFKPNIWFLVAWIGPVLAVLASFGISLLFPGIEFSAEMDYIFDLYSGILEVDQIEQMEEQVAKISPSFLFWMSVGSGLMAGVSINALFAFGEEFGWRGLLQWELRGLGFWKSNLLIGAIWGFWHTPIILLGHNYPDHPVLGVLMMTVWCALMGPIFGYIRIKTKSVIAVSVMHGALNGTATIGVMFLSGGTDLLVGVTGLAGFIVMAGLNLLILVFDRGPLEFNDLQAKPKVLPIAASEISTES